MAKTKFNANAIDWPNSDLAIADLDGDGLKDLVLVAGTSLSIFYQDSPASDSRPNFTREPQRSYRLDSRPCVIWAAKLGGPAESLLVMTSDGVSEYCFTNRNAPPVVRQIIQQSTIIPPAAEGTNTMCLSMSAQTGGKWPLMLLPTPDGLRVWQHRDEWRQAQVIDRAVDSTLRPTLANPGYTNSLELDFSIGDVNSDGRDDLIVRHSKMGRVTDYSVYVQQTNDVFMPALQYSDKVDPFSWLCWTDLNRDGKVDLIKSVWLNEASFIPGVPSSKVMVSTYLANARGELPAEPQQVFRKNDWKAQLPVVDIDGDGYPDLVMGYNHMDNKEALSKQLTTRKLDYDLRFYFNRPGVGFSTEPDCRRDLVIHMDPSGLPLDWSLPLNFVRYVKFEGDFNGDGKTDLLVRDHSDAVSVYFFISRDRGFSRDSDLRFDCSDPMEDWQIGDFNHDGISDLIIKLANHKGLRVYLSQK